MTLGFHIKDFVYIICMFFFFLMGKIIFFLYVYIYIYICMFSY